MNPEKNKTPPEGGVLHVRTDPNTALQISKPLARRHRRASESEVLEIQRGAALLLYHARQQFAEALVVGVADP